MTANGFDFAAWCDWPACAAGLVRALVPELGAAVYIIDDRTAASLGWRESVPCFGYTGPGLSLLVKSHFGGDDRWAGAGFACRICERSCGGTVFGVSTPS